MDDLNEQKIKFRFWTNWTKILGWVNLLNALVIIVDQALDADSKFHSKPNLIFQLIPNSMMNTYGEFVGSFFMVNGSKIGLYVALLLFAFIFTNVQKKRLGQVWGIEHD
jgi:hypothetical protein